MKLNFWPFEKKESLSVPDDELYAVLAGSQLAQAEALSVPAVANAIRTISEAAACLEISLVHRDGTGEADAEHPGLNLLRGEINPWTSGFEFIRDLVGDALTRDTGGLAWVNKINGEPREIIHFKPGHLAIQTEQTREPIYKLDGVRIDASEVIHLRNPFNRCPTNLGRRAIGAAAAMERHAEQFFSKGARPGGVIEVPNNLGEAGLKNMKAGWRAAHEGPDNAGNTAILWGGAKFTPLAFNSVDSQFNESRLFQLQEIARAFNIPPAMIGDLSRATWSNAEQKEKEFLAYCLESWLKALESAFNRALLSDDEREELTFHFDRDDLTRASLTDRATAINSLVSSRVLNPNEGRDWIGLGPRPGGEEFANPNTGASQPGQANGIVSDDDEEQRDNAA